MPQAENTELSFTCSSGSSNPDSRVEWTLNAVNITDQATQYQTPGEYKANFVTSDLDITVTRDMNGHKLECDIMYEGTRDTHDEVTLNITCEYGL
jgi:hypothetical protein